MDHSTPATKPYYDYRLFLTERYGQPLYRIPIDLGFSCPNRDGEGRAGCTFCGEWGARAVHLTPEMDLKTQVDAGVALARDRYKATEFMAYCQAFTSTHAPVDVLRERLTRLLQLHPFRALILSTRPDCLPEKTVSLLAELVRNIDVWIELGVQTANDATLRQVNRGHDFACSVRAIRALNRRGVKTAAHIILGLPGEGPEDFRRTAHKLGRLPLDGVKIHNLHVVADTPLAEQWKEGELTAWNEHEYAEVLMDFLRRIPRTWPVMRLVSDTPSDRLVAPRWWLTKPQFLDYVERQMRERNWTQGDLVQNRRPVQLDSAVEACAGPHVKPDVLTGTRQFGAVPTPEPPAPTSRLWPLLNKLRQTAEAVRNRGGKSAPPPLISKDELRERLSAGSVTVLDVGFGVDGHVLQLLDAVIPGAHGELIIVALGLSPTVVSELKARFPERRGMLEALALRGSASFPGGRITVFWGDPRLQLGRMRGKAHVVILEPSGVEQHVQLYTVDFLRRLTRFLTTHGVIVSPATAKAFRRALQRIGMHIGACYPRRIGRGGTRASRHDYMVTHDLPQKDRRILSRSVSAVPFRDPTFRGSRHSILRHREHVMARLRRRGWQKWVK